MKKKISPEERVYWFAVRFFLLREIEEHRQKMGEWASSMPTLEQIEQQRLIAWDQFLDAIKKAPR